MTNKLPGTILISLGFLITVLAIPGFVAAHPTGMMHDDMEETMEKYGYRQGGGSGYWRHGAGQMMGRGGMMPPMQGMMIGQLGNLDLDKNQRSQVRKLMQDARKSHWNLMEKMMETSDQLVELYEKEKVDAEKIGSVYEKIYKFKIDMIKQHVVTRNKILGLLNKKQKQAFKKQDPFASHFGMMGMMY